MKIAQCTACALAAFMLGGCAIKDGSFPTVEQIDQQKNGLRELTASKTVSILDRPYLGAKKIEQKSEAVSPVLSRFVTLKQRGSLRDIAASLSSLAPLSAQISDIDAEDFSSGKSEKASTSVDEFGLPNLIAPDAKRLNISYSGRLSGLLDTISSQSGYGWEYDEKTSRVTFSAMQVKTFTIMSPPGAVSYEAQLSNKSKERNNSGSLGENVNSTVQTGDTSSQTSQIHKTEVVWDIWKDLEDGLKSLISKNGSISINRSSGTVTVRDCYTRLRDAENYIEDINKKLARQVALTVRVWSLELDDSSGAGLNLQTLFEDGDVSVLAGSLGSLGSPSTAAVSVVKGKLKGSNSTIKALREWGQATQLTSGGGLICNGQPLPIQAVNRQAYIAGMTMATSEYNQTSEITPGEVASGFSMTLVPHIQADKRVLLHYNVTLSSLDGMEVIDKDSVFVQLPKISSRSFSQRSAMQLGQTLVLAGFEQSSQTSRNNVGLFNSGRDTAHTKTLIIVTIELESAESV